MPGNPFDNIAILSDIYDEDEGVQQLVDSGQVTTASNINRPREPKIIEPNLFAEFNLRNPKADGGMLVKPSADGSRPGYQGRPSKKTKLTKKQIQEIYKDLPENVYVMGQKRGKDKIPE